MPHALRERRAVVERTHRHARAEQVGHLHRDIQTRRRTMEAEAQIGAADHSRIVFRLEPACAQVNTPRRQTGKPPFELDAPGAVTGDENDEIGESRRGIRRLPAADAVLEPPHGIDDDVEVFVFGPACRTHDEAHHAGVDAQAGEQRLPVAFPLDVADWNENRGRPIVQNVRVREAQPVLEEFGEPSRHAEVGLRLPRVVTLEPSRKPDGRVPLPQPQLQQRVADVVPVDDESNAFPFERQPRHDERGKRGRILDEHQIGSRQPPQRRPQPETDAARVYQRDRRVAEAGRPVAQHRRRQPVHCDVFVVGDRASERRALEADQININAVSRQRLGVVPHTGASSQISEGDDDGSHDGRRNRGRAAL